MTTEESQYKKAHDLIKNFIADLTLTLTLDEKKVFTYANDIFDTINELYKNQDALKLKKTVDANVAISWGKLSGIENKINDLLRPLLGLIIIYISHHQFRNSPRLEEIWKKLLEITHEVKKYIVLYEQTKQHLGGGSRKRSKMPRRRHRTTRKSTRRRRS